jgi:uncharacterized RDD family membrane protein YckC
MFCSKCGANVADGAAFCSACGQPIVGFSVAQAAPGTPAAPPVPAVPAGPSHAPPVQAGWQAPAVRPAVAYAGFWLRFVAWIIDRIVLQVASSILTLPFAATMGLREILRHHQPVSPEEVFPLLASMEKVFLIVLVLSWLYYALLESSSWQGTLGKKALGLEVTDLAGSRISFGRATGRYFARWISVMTVGIGYIMAGFTEKKQALHDIIAGTLVIRKL